jgi:rhamnogalacturonan endolyase
VWAFDRDLRPVWRYDSRNQSGGHWLTPFDIDDDGRDEILYGGICIGPTGQARWVLAEITGDGHMDIVQPGDLVSGNHTNEVAYGSELGGAIVMVDQNGEVLWPQVPSANWPIPYHVHSGMIADFDPDIPGDEIVARGKGRNAHASAVGYTCMGEPIEPKRG